MALPVSEPGRQKAGTRASPSGGATLFLMAPVIKDQEIFCMEMHGKKLQTALHQTSTFISSTADACLCTASPFSNMTSDHHNTRHHSRGAASRTCSSAAGYCSSSRGGGCCGAPTGAEARGGCTWASVATDTCRCKSGSAGGDDSNVMWGGGGRCVTGGVPSKGTGSGFVTGLKEGAAPNLAGDLPTQDTEVFPGAHIPAGQPSVVGPAEGTGGCRVPDTVKLFPSHWKNLEADILALRQRTFEDGREKARLQHCLESAMKELWRKESCVAEKKRRPNKDDGQCRGATRQASKGHNGCSHGTNSRPRRTGDSSSGAQECAQSSTSGADSEDEREIDGKERGCCNSFVGDRCANNVDGGRRRRMGPGGLDDTNGGEERHRSGEEQVRDGWCGTCPLTKRIDPESVRSECRLDSRVPRNGSAGVANDSTGARKDSTSVRKEWRGAGSNSKLAGNDSTAAGKHSICPGEYLTGVGKGLTWLQTVHCDKRGSDDVGWVRWAVKNGSRLDGGMQTGSTVGGAGKHRFRAGSTWLGGDQGERGAAAADVLVEVAKLKEQVKALSSSIQRLPCNRNEPAALPARTATNQVPVNGPGGDVALLDLAQQGSSKAAGAGTGGGHPAAARPLGDASNRGEGRMVTETEQLHWPLRPVTGTEVQRELFAVKRTNRELRHVTRRQQLAIHTLTRQLLSAGDPPSATQMAVIERRLRDAAVAAPGGAAGARRPVSAPRARLSYNRQISNSKDANLTRGIVTVTATSMEGTSTPWIPPGDVDVLVGSHHISAVRQTPQKGRPRRTKDRFYSAPCDLCEDLLARGFSSRFCHVHGDGPLAIAVL